MRLLPAVVRPPLRRLTHLLSTTALQIALMMEDVWLMWSPDVKSRHDRATARCDAVGAPGKLPVSASAVARLLVDQPGRLARQQSRDILQLHALTEVPAHWGPARRPRAVVLTGMTIRRVCRGHRAAASVDHVAVRMHSRSSVLSTILAAEH